MFQKILLTLLLLFLIFIGCKKPHEEPKSNAKSIKSFILKSSNNSVLSQDIAGVIKGDSIILNIPDSIPVSNLLPTITITGSSITPASNSSVNFNQPVHYTVSAEDGSTRVYVAQVHKTNGLKRMLSFSFTASKNTSLANDIIGNITNDSVILYMPAGTDTKSLIPTITYQGEKLSPGDVQAQDFTKQVNYTVSADDGTSAVYKVIVTTSYALFVGSQNGHLYSLNPVTGKVNWEFNAGGQLSSPVCANGNVYAGNGKSFFALDAYTGALKWQNKSFSGYFTRPVADNGIIYAGLRSLGNLYYQSANYIFAFDDETGSVKWFNRLNLGADNAGTTSVPTVSNGIVLISEYNTGVFAFDATSGNRLWGFGPSLTVTTPILDGNSIYYGTAEGIMYKANVQTHEYTWVNRAGGNVFSSPLLYNNIIYTGGWIPMVGKTLDCLFALNADDGTIKWRYPATDDIELGARFSTPTIFNNALYASGGNLLYAVDLSTGQLKWSYNAGTGSPSSYLTNPIVNDGTLFVTSTGQVATGTGQDLLVFDAISGALKWHFDGDGSLNTDACIMDISGKACNYPGHPMN